VQVKANGEKAKRQEEEGRGRGRGGFDKMVMLEGTAERINHPNVP